MNQESEILKLAKENKIAQEQYGRDVGAIKEQMREDHKVLLEYFGTVNNKLDKNAHSNKGDQLVCDIAVIHSLKEKYSSAVGSNVSATHGASLWHFPNQTNVKITRSHQEIENAIRGSDQDRA